MRFLVVTPYLPLPDRGSGELRLTTLLRVLAERHEVVLYTWEARTDVDPERDEGVHRRALIDRGVTLETGGLRRVLRHGHFDAVIFEWYYWVAWYLDDVLAWQPQARIVIDTVDLEFRRLALKAALSGDPSEGARAREAREQEMAAYARADLLLTVSDEETAILAQAGCRTPVTAVPNVHTFADALPPLTEDPALIFIGNFRFEPNIDAVRYLCRDIFPAVRGRVPAATLRIVGHAPTPEIRALVGNGVDVTGYVPDTTPYLASSRVSVAPLRYGAGMKGKVGEAMAYGLPVVTTGIGAQGMGLTPGRDVLVADTAADFAETIVRLLGDGPLCETLRAQAWEHMRTHFGVDAMRRRLDVVCELIAQAPPRPPSPLRQWRRRSRHWLERTVVWRAGAHSRGAP